MNAILNASSFIFPFITFPYISRVLLPYGVGKVNFATSVVSYFSMFAMLGIPTYGVRICAQVRDDKRELSLCCLFWRDMDRSPTAGRSGTFLHYELYDPF